MDEPSLKRIKKITSQWFFKEPLLYSVYLTHSLVQNSMLKIPFRSGKQRLEFCPQIVDSFSDELLEENLKIEIFRILLKHPYQRQPYNCHKKSLYLASDVVIYQLMYEEQIKKNQIVNVSLAGVEYLKSQAARFKMLEHPLGEKWAETDELKFFQKNLNLQMGTGNLVLIDHLSFEQWYKKILFLISQTSISGEQAGYSFLNEEGAQEAGELWQEDESMQQLLSDQIQKAQVDEGWGGIGGNQQRDFLQDSDFSFDYRRALSKFRQNIVSANRKLTRMRPSRRYGFKAMGSRYERKANILIGVDVSGSITDESYNNFYHAIKNFFFLGLIEKMDLMFFDVNLKNSEPVTFKKKIELDQIKGRGGTSFQPILDYFFEHKTQYSGLILFTDGEGDVPKLQASGVNILWILDSRLAFEKNHQWITKTLGCQATYLPF